MTIEQLQSAMSWVIGVSLCGLTAVAAGCVAALAIRITYNLCCL